MAMTEKQVLALGLSPLETVRRYARENYNKGWDCIVEAVDDTDLLEVLGPKATPNSALKRAYQHYVKPYIEFLAEHQSEINAFGMAD
jgi:hypothetical protein